MPRRGARGGGSSHHGRRKKRAQFGKLTRESDVCVLCGSRPAVTKDHVPPESIFLTKPTEYLTVPACYECNQETRLDEDFMHQVLAGASWTKEGLDVWRAKVRPRLKEKPGTRLGLRDLVAPASFDLPGVGRLTRPAIMAPTARINPVIRKMVRGLHWFHTGRILAAEVPIEILSRNSVELAALGKNPEQMKVIDGLGMGIYRDSRTIRSFFYKAGIDERASLWLFFFYRQNLFIAATGESAGLLLS